MAKSAFGYITLQGLIDGLIPYCLAISLRTSSLEEYCYCPDK